ncbi:MAG TPA: hypothetical protein P5277_00105 [Candidatus Paceibacterota bacterium]|nr:hypothetical protein [Candidatus Paceibacterota bacterium]
MTVPKRQRQKKIKLAKAGTQTHWAPFWTIVRKHGAGKKMHPYVLTHVKRNWRTRKLKIKPRRIQKKHLG